MDQYQQNLWAHSQNTKVVTTAEDLDSFLINTAKQSLSTFNYQYLAAASALTGGKIVAWFNNQFYHTAPLALNLVHNAIVRAVINPAYSIHIANAPFDYLVQPNGTNVDDSKVSLFSASFTFAIGIAMPMVSASYIMFYIQVNRFHNTASNMRTTLIHTHCSHLTGKSLSCKVFAICKRNQFEHFLDSIDLVGCPDEHDDRRVDRSYVSI